MAEQRTEPSYDTRQFDLRFPTLEGRVDAAPENVAQPKTYYDLPLVKPPSWKWFIPAYFFVGGVAGGVALIGALADLFGGKRHRSTVRHARYLAVVLAALCPIPLIVDLGRPARFHHMLRMVKFSSPLNLGTWILSAFGMVSGALAARQAAEDGLVLRRGSRLARLLRRVPARPLSALHGVLGVALGGYTGVLLAATAVPLWAAAGLLLGPLFLVTAVASGAAALTLLGLRCGRANAPARAELETVQAVSNGAQLTLSLAREVLVPERSARPLQRGLWGWVYRAGAVGGGMATPLALRIVARLAGPRASQNLAALSATLTLLGSLAERFAIVEAGKESARDPLATRELTRGAPGEARPTAAEQARHAPHAPAHATGIAARDVSW